MEPLHGDREEHALRADFPTHDVWYVTAVYSPAAWCSKPKDVRGSTLIMYHPDDLRDAIQRELQDMSTERIEVLAAMPGVFGRRKQCAHDLETPRTTAQQGECPAAPHDRERR